MGFLPVPTRGPVLLVTRRSTVVLSALVNSCVVSTAVPLCLWTLGIVFVCRSDQWSAIAEHREFAVNKQVDTLWLFLSWCFRHHGMIFVTSYLCLLVNTQALESTQAQENLRTRFSTPFQKGLFEKSRFFKPWEFFLAKHFSIAKNTSPHPLGWVLEAIVCLYRAIRTPSSGGGGKTFRERKNLSQKTPLVSRKIPFECGQQSKYFPPPSTRTQRGISLIWVVVKKCSDSLAVCLYVCLSLSMYVSFNAFVLKSHTPRPIL